MAHKGKYGHDEEAETLLNELNKGTEEFYSIKEWTTGDRLLAPRINKMKGDRTIKPPKKA